MTRKRPSNPRCSGAYPLQNAVKRRTKVISPNRFGQVIKRIHFVGQSSAVARAHPKLARLMDGAEADVLAYMTYPRQHRANKGQRVADLRYSCIAFRSTAGDVGFPRFLTEARVGSSARSAGI